MPPEKHALLSASSASRWLKCTAAPRFEEHLPERTSEYAEEGRLAHAICELKTLKKFTVMTSRTYTTRLNKLKKDPLYSEEMDKTSDLYIEHLIEQAMLYDSTPTVVAEVQVDFGEYVPEGFGTCDNVMIGGDTLSITDYKHGKGVPVSAVGNPQMRLYALGALKRYAPVFGDAIKKVRMSIDQPRLDSYTTDTITVEELLAWGENIKPIAQKAFSGLGEFAPGDHCRFAVARLSAVPVPTPTRRWRTSRTACLPPPFRLMLWSPRSFPTSARMGMRCIRSSLMQRSVTSSSVARSWWPGTRTWRNMPPRPCWTASLLRAGNWWLAGASAPLRTRMPPSKLPLPPDMMRPCSMTASPRRSLRWRN